MTTIFVVHSAQGKALLAFASEERADEAARFFQGGSVTSVHYEDAVIYNAPPQHPRPDQTVLSAEELQPLILK